MEKNNPISILRKQNNCSVQPYNKKVEKFNSSSAYNQVFFRLFYLIKKCLNNFIGTDIATILTNNCNCFFWQMESKIESNTPKSILRKQNNSSEQRYNSSVENPNHSYNTVSFNCSIQ